MPASASGVSKQRSSPNFAVRPSVIRKTPPSAPTSSPKTRTRSSAFIASHRAAFSACAMVVAAISALLGAQLGRQPRALLAQLRGRLGEDVLEQLQRVGRHV